MKPIEPKGRHFACLYCLALLCAAPLMGGYWRYFPLSVIWFAWGFPMVWGQLLSVPREFVHVVAAVAYVVYIATAVVGIKRKSKVALALFAVMLAGNVIVAYATGK